QAEYVAGEGAGVPGSPRQRAPARPTDEGSSRQQTQRETKRHVGLYVMVTNAMAAAGFAPRRDFSLHGIGIRARQLAWPHDDAHGRLRMAEAYLGRTGELHFGGIHQMKHNHLMPAVAQVPQGCEG